jgi:4-diphosphocytidyl-2-C-methyl-D-erythritol kinase
VSLVETAYAKINLALHVRRGRSDGYHQIETIFAFADFGDRLGAELAEEISLEVSGPFAEGLSAGPENLVVRAARLLSEHAGARQGARLRLFKALPVAAGIGGGSADAAAALRLLSRLWDLGLDQRALAEMGAALGADVGACVASVTSRGEGVGERLEPLGGELSGMPLLLVNPRLPLSTAPVFAGWDGVDRGPLGPGSILTSALAGRNDLEAPAVALVPAIADVLEWLRARAGATMARMSGSGATCFALFESTEAAAEAQSETEATHKGWWTAQGALR